MHGNAIFNILDAILSSITLHKDEIEKLDQSIGDGDHIFNLLRGLNEVTSLRASLVNENLDIILKQIGLKIMTTIGGSSGALFATLLINMAKNSDKSLNEQRNISNMFYRGVKAMKDRGKAEIGDKTMLDVLLPVSEKFYDLSFKNPNNINSFEIAKELSLIAEQKMLDTKDMLAKKGRASYLGERSLGHIDPGARSSQIIIKAICDFIIDNPEEKNEKIYK